MGRCYIQIVMGPAGSGKSTYCQAMQYHASTLGASRKRTIHVANLDPAAEDFGYQLAFDIRDLISVEEVMEELNLGPNGGLIYCMEFLLNNLDWLQDHLDSFGDDEYLILDCPGQLELYTHIPLMRNLIDRMKMWGYNHTMAAVFLLDATFVADTSKFLSGSLLSLSAMIALELPHTNILTKCDLLTEAEVEEVLDYGGGATQLWDREQDRNSILMPNHLSTTGNSPFGNDDRNIIDRDNVEQEITEEVEITDAQRNMERRRRHRQRLTDSISQLLDDYSMICFVPLNIKDEDSVDNVLACVDASIQYGENLEVRDYGDGDGEGNDEYGGGEE
jgi:GTPase SAR1 family protein